MRLHPHFSRRRTAARWLGLTACLFLAFAAGGDTVVAPNNLATADYPFGAGTLAAANYRAQEVYGAQHFPPDIALVITELRFRPDYFYGRAFTTTISNIQFRLSTTQKNPDGLSPTFANNVGFDETLVFSGSLPMSSQFNGPPGGPKDFDMVVPLTTPFLYNPAAGNLLLDIRNFSGSTASPVSGRGIAGDGGSRVGGSLASPTGGPDTGIEALQIIYTPTNQPPVPPQPTLLTRGPYLQSGTTSNLIVRWRTNRNTNSVVQFGTLESPLSWGVTNEVRTNEHVVTLTNLAPDTKYFYSIGTADTNLAGGTNYFFVTAPIGGKPTRIWVVGDAGTANQPDTTLRNPFGMRDAYYAHTGSRYTDLFMMLGDNAYGIGTDEEYSTNVFGTFPDMLRQTVVWSTIGNHDAVNTATYQNIFSFPQNGEAGGVPSGTELYYSFNYGNIHFVCLDSEVSANDSGGPMLTWLQQDLEDNTNQWLIAFWHSPPYNYGSHNSDSLADSSGHLVQMRENVVPVLENYGVDLVLCGHSHAYERSFLLDGHYGYANSITPNMRFDSGSGREDDSGAYLKAGLAPTAHEGAVYVVCGSSGWVTPPVVSLDLYLRHPAMFIGLPLIGSMVLDIDGDRLDAKFLTAAGIAGDYFTLRKGASPEPLKVKSIRIANGSVALQFKTVAGQRYQVERATQLDPADWLPAGGEIVATGATSKWTGPAPADGNYFYRIALITN